MRPRVDFCAGDIKEASIVVPVNELNSRFALAIELIGIAVDNDSLLVVLEQKYSQ